MRDTLVVIGIALIVIAVGAWFYFHSASATSVATLTQDQASAPAVVTATDIPITPLASGFNASVTTRKNYAISTDDDLRQLWKMADEQGPAPTVDFTKDQVIAVFAGTEPTGGYDIKVSKVTDGASRSVTITLVSPGGSCAVTEAVTSPYQIVTIPRSDLPLSHTDLAETASCLR